MGAMGEKKALKSDKATVLAIILFISIIYQWSQVSINLFYPMMN